MSTHQKKPKIMDYIKKHYRQGIIIGYVVFVLFFFIAEIVAQLGDTFLSQIRATNQVLILLGLLFFPFLFSVLISLIERLKVSVGGVEVEAEFGKIKRKVKAIETGQSELSGRVDHTQLVFLSILRGKNRFREERLRIPKLVIGCKDFKEQKILSLMLTQHIKRECGIQCECLIPNGGTFKNHFDLVNGWIDGYIEYTGTGCMLLDVDPQRKPEVDRDLLNEQSNKLDHGVKWLDPLWFTNNYVIVVKKDKIENVKYIHQLKEYADRLTFGGNLEFMNRSDGYVGLCKNYGLEFKQKVVCGYSDRYRMLNEGKVDVIEGFETDPELRDEKLQELDDINQFFPEYYPLPVFREDALDGIENLRGIVKQFKERLKQKLAEKKIDISEMIAQFSDFSGTTDEELREPIKQVNTFFVK